MVDCKIVILGDGGVGKTALAVKFFDNIPLEEQNHGPTIFDTYQKEILINCRPYVLNVIDLSGLEAYATTRDQYIREAEAILLVYSIDSKTSFEYVLVLLQRIHEIYGLRCKLSHSSLSSSTCQRGKRSALVKLVPVLLVANKCDRSTERAVSVDQGLKLAKRIGCTFIEASVAWPNCSENLFHALAQQFLQRKKKS